MKNKTIRRILMISIICSSIIVMLSGCSASLTRTSRQMSFDEFESKYRTANFEAFLENPEEFCQDFLSVNEFVKNATENPFEDWETEEIELPDDRGSYKQYERDIRLFNRNFRFDGGEFNDKDASGRAYSGRVLGLMMESGSADDNYAFTESITTYMFGFFKDNYELEITIDGEESTETELKKLFARDELGSGFNLTMTNDQYYFSIWFESASAYSDGYAYFSFFPFK